MELYEFEGIQQSNGEIAIYTRTDGDVKFNIILKIDNITGSIKNSYIINYEDKELLSKILFTSEPTHIESYSLVDLILNKSLDAKELSKIVKSAFNYLFSNESFRLCEYLKEQLDIFHELAAYESPLGEMEIPKYHCKSLYKLINFSRMNFTINTMEEDALNKLDYVLKDLALGGIITKIWKLDVEKNFEIWSKIKHYPNYSPIKLALSTIDPITLDCNYIAEKIKFNAENYFDYFELGTGLVIGENISEEYLTSEISKGTDIRSIIEICLATLDGLNLDILCDNNLDYRDILNTRVLLGECNEAEVNTLIAENCIRGDLLDKVRYYVSLGFSLNLFLDKDLTQLKLERIVAANSDCNLTYSSKFSKEEKALAFDYLRKKGVDCNRFKHLNNNKLEIIVKFRNPSLGHFIDTTSDDEFLLLAEVLQQAPNLFMILKDLDISKEELEYLKVIPKDNATYRVLSDILNSHCCREIRLGLLEQLHKGNKQIDIVTWIDNFDAYSLTRRFDHNGILSRVAVFADSKIANIIYKDEETCLGEITGFIINNNYNYIDTLVSYRESGGFTDYIDYSILYETLLIKL